MITTRYTTIRRTSEGYYYWAVIYRGNDVAEGRTYFPTEQQAIDDAYAQLTSDIVMRDGVGNEVYLDCRGLTASSRLVAVICNEDLDYLAGTYPLRNPQTGELLMDRDGNPIKNPNYFEIMAERERRERRIAERVKRAGVHES